MCYYEPVYVNPDFNIIIFTGVVRNYELYVSGMFVTRGFSMLSLVSVYKKQNTKKKKQQKECQQGVDSE